MSCIARYGQSQMNCVVQMKTDPFTERSLELPDLHQILDALFRQEIRGILHTD